MFKKWLSLVLLFAALPVHAQSPPDLGSLVQLMGTAPITLPVGETRVEWKLADARPRAISHAIRIVGFEVFWGVDATRKDEFQRKADLRLAIVRERPRAEGGGKEGTAMVIRARDHYQEPSGDDVYSIISLPCNEIVCGYVIRPDDVVALVFSAEPVLLPAGYSPTRANIVVRAYWVPEPEEDEEVNLGN